MKRKIYLIAAITSLISINSFAQYPTNGLIGFYPFNANIEDVSSNSADMSANDAPSFAPDRFGQFNALNADFNLKAPRLTYSGILSRTSNLASLEYLKPALVIFSPFTITEPERIREIARCKSSQSPRSTRRASSLIFSFCNVNR